MSYWKQLERHQLYRSDWLTFTVDKVQLPNGRVIENFELIHLPHSAVGLVAADQSGKILLVRAYRYLHETFDWEVPGGVVEEGENHMDAARRELLEETGYSASLLTPMISFLPFKALCDQRFFLYIAEGLQKTASEYQKEEVSEIGFFDPKDVHAMIDKGEIDDGMSLVALLTYFQRKGA